MYKENLEGQKILFLYGIPLKVKQEIRLNYKKLCSIESYEAIFHRHNFLHLTGVKLNYSYVYSSNHFYDKCLNHRLTEHDFDFVETGSTRQKLDILENMMKIKSSAIMIGDFTDNGPKLFAEKAAGNVCGCIGFTKDRNSGLNVPNTLLKKDIRNVVNSPVRKIYAIISKACTEEKYSVVEKLDKCIDIKECLFSDEIEKILDSKIRST